MAMRGFDVGAVSAIWPRLAAAGALVLALVAGTAPGVHGQQATPPIAGTQPDRRPEGAPRILSAEHSSDWLAWASRGVTPPNPPSLKFLADQGNWYTPFTHPGMIGPYDIRGLHGAAKPSAPPN